MKIRIVPHGEDCLHDTAVMHGDTLLLCESVANTQRRAPDLARRLVAIDAKVYEVKYQGEKARALRELASESIRALDAAERRIDELTAMVMEVV